MGRKLLISLHGFFFKCTTNSNEVNFLFNSFTFTLIIEKYYTQKACDLSRPCMSALECILLSLIHDLNKPVSA